MEEDPITLLLKFGVLAVLYLFLLLIARSARRDLRRTEESAAPPAPAAGVVGDNDLPHGLRPSLVVVAAMSQEPGTTFELRDDATLGRADTADVKVDDPYASSAHARIFSRGQFMYIEDMGSTNGTFLNGRPVHRPEQLRSTDTVRIGDTEYRYEE